MAVKGATVMVSMAAISLLEESVNAVSTIRTVAVNLAYLAASNISSHSLTDAAEGLVQFEEARAI